MGLKINRKGQNDEETVKQVRKLLEEKGRETLELTKKLMLENEEKLKSVEVRKALRYFAHQYWSDLARPTLMSLACEAVGGDCQTVTPIAVPIMLLTGGIDIHDDIIDQSTNKDGRLTVFGKFGKNIALLTGDALLFKGLMRLSHALTHINGQKVIKVLKIIEKTFGELGDAEALELRFKARIEVHPEEYLRIVKKKAADVEAYTCIGAIIGNGKKQEIEALRKYGRVLGMLAIIRDDLIDMMDEEELVHRLRNEVAPLPVLYAAQNSKAKTFIDSAIMKKRMDTRKLIQTVISSNGIDKTEKKMMALAEEGLSSLKIIKHKKEELQLLTTSMTII
jgi:geranylgeranyl pyrophosphate synthase